MILTVYDNYYPYDNIIIKEQYDFFKKNIIRYASLFVNKTIAYKYDL